MLRSYACFFFLFLSPSGAERPDFFLFYSTFWQAPFFSDRKKNNRHILGDYSTGVLCDRICSCVTNGAGFLLASFPFQSSCLLPYTKKRKKKAISYTFLFKKKKKCLVRYSKAINPLDVPFPGLQTPRPLPLFLFK